MTPYNAFTQFSTEQPEEVKKVILTSFVESSVKVFFGTTKFLRWVIEAPKPNRADYVADEQSALNL